MTSTKEPSATVSKPVIRDFYADSIVFVTGGTGFLGKALLEKLLRTCNKVQTVYVLMREKKQQNCNDRFQKWLQDSVFDEIRSNQPEQLKKLICVSGDMAKPELGISSADRRMLCERVNIVIHAAATVRFDEPINVAVGMNTVGTQQIMNLCTAMTQLKSVVYVSTAYTNPGRNFVEEKVYPTVPQEKKSNLLWLLGAVSDEAKVQGEHPNTYTFTKSMAENLVRDYHDQQNLPVCIVRPSIIGCALSEPKPSWVEGMHGVTGFIMEVNRGTLQCIIANPDAKMDVIPVDYVVNMILAAAWYNFYNLKKTDAIDVFHCTTGQRNPLNWRDGNALIAQNGRDNPSKFTLLFPNNIIFTNRVIYLFFDFLFHYMPALIYDRYLETQRQKAKYFKLVKKRAEILRSVEFFTFRTWVFDTKNTLKLQNAVQQAVDGKEFPFDVSAIDWLSYSKQYWAGAKKYVMKDTDDEHRPETIKRLKTIQTYLDIMRVLFWAVLILIPAMILYSKMIG